MNGISAGSDESVVPEGLLAPYRILDLTDERGLLAGHLLAQLGADVIQVEQPGGSRARGVGPFEQGQGEYPASLFWAAYAAGKRSIVVAIDTPEGRDLLLRLVAEADMLIESAEPGRMAELGLDYAQLRTVNPRLIHVSITAYGSDGPKAHYADSDLTVWASAGPLALSRAPSGLPLRISAPQTFHHAAADAACGALMALLARGESGTGQHVEVSAQASTTICTLFGHLAAAVNHEDYSMANAGSEKKQLDLSGSGARTIKTKWLVRDGIVEMHVGIGTAAGRFSNALFGWLREIGDCPDEFAGWDWIKVPQRIEAGEITMEQVDRARDHVGDVLARYTLNELVVVAQDKGLMLAPILTTADLLDSPQLVAREFFVPIEEGDRTRLLPAPFNGCGIRHSGIRPAPAIGAHNAEVLEELLGLSVADVAGLVGQGIVR